MNNYLNNADMALDIFLVDKYWVATYFYFCVSRLRWKDDQITTKVAQRMISHCSGNHAKPPNITPTDILT